MRKFRVLLASSAFLLTGVVSASAALPTPAYVDARAGSNSNAGTGCQITAPCADLNTALSVISTNGEVIFLSPGTFGPVILTGKVTLIGVEPAGDVKIVADTTATPGCIGAAPGSCGANNGYAVEIAAGVSDSIKISHITMQTGSSGGVGALKFTTGGQLSLRNDNFRGGPTSNTPIVQLYPNNPGTTQAQVYFAWSDIAFNNTGANAGAVEVKPSGNTSLKLHFNHVEVHNASYGIRSDASLLSGPAVVVATAVSECEFFSFNNAAINAFSTSGTGTMDAVYNNVNVLNALAGAKANGPQTSVVFTNSTITGNGTGVQILNGGTMITSGNNTVQGNGTDVNGTLTLHPLQ